MPGVKLRSLFRPVVLLLALGCGTAEVDPAKSSTSSAAPASARSTGASAKATASAAPSASAVAAAPSTTSSASSAPTAEADWSELPMVAVWQQVSHREVSPPGSPPPRVGPALRFAVWSSGRTVFAKDATSWDSPLVEGKLSESALKTLSDSLTKTAVFDLRGTTYLVPDAPVLVTLVRVGGREQILYWDEVEAPNYGFNSHPKPHHLDFKRAWKAVTDAVKASLPAASKAYSGTFSPPPTWYIKPAIQSE